MADFVCSTAPGERMLGAGEVRGSTSRVCCPSCPVSRTVSLVNLSKCSGVCHHSWTQRGARLQHQTPTWERLITAALEEAADRNAYMAYPAEAHQENVVERGPIDDPTGDSGQPVPGTELPEAEEMEQEELDQFVFPGMIHAEQLRKKEWLQIPRQARQALRRLHHMLGHKPKSVMRQVLKAGGAPPEQLRGVELFHCDKCDEAVPPLRLHPVKAPARYTFNHEVLIYVLEAKDAAGERISFLSIVCNGTLFHVVAMVSPGGGTPSSRKCAAKFAASWVAWAGWPFCVTRDRGVHSRGVFAQVLSAHGVYLRTAGVEAAEQIVRCERHGGLIKQNLSLVVTACGIEGKAAMKMAAATCVSAKNELVRQGGIATRKWVLGKFPRGVGHMLEEEELGQLGVLEHQTDSATEFGMRAKWRLESMKAFGRQDCSARLARARLRQSGPIDMEFKAGDLIMYRKAEGPRWHGPGRIIGFDHKVLWTLRQGTQWQWQQEERDRRTCQRFWLTWCWVIVSLSVVESRRTTAGFRGHLWSSAHAQ